MDRGLTLRLQGTGGRLEWELAEFTDVGEERFAFLDKTGEVRLILTADELAELQQQAEGVP